MTICSSIILCIRIFLNKYGKPSQISPNVYMTIVTVCYKQVRFCVQKSDIYFYQSTATNSILHKIK